MGSTMTSNHRHGVQRACLLPLFLKRHGCGCHSVSAPEYRLLSFCQVSSITDTILAKVYS